MKVLRLKGKREKMNSRKKKKLEKDTCPDLSLKCIYCGSKAEINGR